VGALRSDHESVASTCSSVADVRQARSTGHKVQIAARLRSHRRLLVGAKNVISLEKERQGSDLHAACTRNVARRGEIGAIEAIILTKRTFLRAQCQHRNEVR
jgi:hypothetical protein